jgi:hypothetical protein
VIFNNEINIYAETGEAIHTFENVSFKKIQYLDDAYLYALVDESSEPIKHTVFLKDKTKVPVVKYIPHNQKTGLYIFDMSRLIKEQKIESYLLQKTTTVIRKKLEYSPFTQRMAVLQDFNQLIMMPICHRNTISFLGMGQ